MNTNFASIIKRIIAEQGESILGDSARLKPFIKDYAQNVPQDERRAFGRCIEMGAYTGLKNAHTQAERRDVKAAFLPHIQAASGLPAALCRDALDVLEAAVFGVQAAAPPPVYQPPRYTPPNPPPYTPPGQPVYPPQYQYSNQPPPASDTSGKWTAVLVLNILGLNCISRFITGHIGTGILVLLLTLSCVFGIPIIAFLILWIVDLVKICTRKWQTAAGTYLVP